MPGHFSATLMFVFLVAIAVAANQAEEGGRGPASLPSKAALLEGSMSKAPSLIHTQKMHGPLYVSVEIEGALPQRKGDVFVLRGSFVAHKTVNGVDFSWTVPAGVEVVSGVTSGHLNSVGPEAPANVELTLRMTSDDNSQIHLIASANRGAGHFADSAQFNTTGLQTAQEAQLKIYH